MCGIVGYVGPKEAVPILLEGLSRLEYRGYDSAGMATIEHGKLSLRKSLGRTRKQSSLSCELLRQGQE